MQAGVEAQVSLVAWPLVIVVDAETKPVVIAVKVSKVALIYVVKEAEGLIFTNEGTPPALLYVP
jgi:hypothetical protein